MKKKHYNAEYKQQPVYRVNQGHESLPAIARDFGVSVRPVRDWIKQVEKSANTLPGSGNIVLILEEAMLRKLARENRGLREEVENLKKAAAYYTNSLV